MGKEERLTARQRGGTTMLFSWRELRRLILPLLAEQTLALTIGMFDTIMIASVGESAVSGVSLVESINVLLITVFTALAAGGAIVAGQYLGRQDPESSGHAAKQLVITALLLSLVVTAVCLIFNRPVLAGIYGRIEPDVMAHARTYFYLTALSYPFIAVYNAAAALFRSMGNSKISMLNALIMNVLNIGGNALFIFGFGWGVFGAGLATLISRALACITMVTMLRNPKLLICVRNYHLTDIDLKMIRRILRIAVPNSLENSMFQIGKLLLATLVTTFGTSAITANAVGNSMAMIGIIPGSAMGMALITVVSRCVGAGEYDQARYYIKRLMGMAYLFMIVLNTALLLLRGPILSIYRLSDSTTALATQIMFAHSLAAMLIWPMSFSLPNAFRAAGDVKYTMVISIFSMWVFRIGLSYIFSYFLQLGVMSVWYAMFADWIFRSCCFGWRYVRGRWQRHAVL